VTIALFVKSHRYIVKQSQLASSDQLSQMNLIYKKHLDTILQDKLENPDVIMKSDE